MDNMDNILINNNIQIDKVLDTSLISNLLIENITKREKKIVYIKMNKIFVLKLPSIVLFSENFIIISIKLLNDIENIEYKITHYEHELIPKRKINKGENIYFDELFPLNFRTYYLLYIIFYLESDNNLVKFEFEAVELDREYNNNLKIGVHKFYDTKKDISLLLNNSHIKMTSTYSNISDKTNYEIFKSTQYDKIKIAYIIPNKEITNILEINDYKQCYLNNSFNIILGFDGLILFIWFPAQ
jgi:hypothetical protein